MENTTKELIYALISSRRESVLKQIRQSYTRNMPLEEILEEDQEVCNIIDTYFKEKQNILDKIDEIVTDGQLEGYNQFEFEYEFFHVDVCLKVNFLPSFAGNRITPADAAEIEIIQININEIS